MKEQLLLENISKYVVLNEEEWSEIKGHLTERHFERGAFLTFPGEINKYTNFITKGSVRVYYIGHDGQEHNVQLGLPGWWIGDYSSFIMQHPGRLYTEALEPTKVFSFSFEELEALYVKLPKMERFFRLLVQRAYASFQERMLSNLSEDAGERYLHFSNKYPLMDQKISQKNIASYLGMSAEFLSKIKKRIAERERVKPKS